MDFQNLGKHCFESTCRQKDFLPFECRFCENVFCLDHRETSAHACPKSNIGDMKAIKCPICLKTLVYDASQSNEHDFWQIHSDTDCDPSRYDRVMEERSKSCAVAHCKTKLTTLNRYACGKCIQELCLKHRFEDQHVCMKIEDIPEKSPVKSPVLESPKPKEQEQAQANRQQASQQQMSQPQQQRQPQQQQQPSHSQNQRRNMTLNSFLSSPLTKSASEVNQVLTIILYISILFLHLLLCYFLGLI